ncbi:MAG: class I SAM-dependent methyltransferase [Chloroflexota bacterium]
MAEHHNLYQLAVYYDVALCRDVTREVEFMTALYRRHTGRELQSVLEIACGPGYHTRAFARRGVRAVGLDLRPEMLELAQEKAAADGAPVTWLAADMRHFQLDATVDMAFCMFDGMDALSANEDVVQHFRCIAQYLTPGGLYLVDLTHPRDCAYHQYGSFRYAGERDGIQVEIVWGVNQPHFDLITGVAHSQLEIRINDHGHRMVIHDAADERLFMPQELVLLAELSGALRVVAWHGNYDVNQSLDDSPASQRMVAVLQKL